MDLEVVSSRMYIAEKVDDCVLPAEIDNFRRAFVGHKALDVLDDFGLGVKPTARGLAVCLVDCD